MKRIVLPGLAALLAAGLLFRVADRDASPPVSGDVERAADVIAEVDGVAITEARWAERLADYPEVDQKRLLQAEVKRMAVLSAARRAGFADHPAVRERYEEAMIAQFIASELDERVRDVSVDAAEIEAYLAANPLKQPEPLRRAAIIRQTVDEGNDRDAAHAQLTDALQAVDTVDSPLAHFGELAARYSDDQASRHRGGVSGFFRRERSEHDRMPEAVHEALWRLGKAGDVSDIIDTDDAAWIVRFVDETSSGGQSLEAQSNAAERRLLEIKRGRARDAFFAEVNASADIYIAEGWRAAEPAPADDAPPAPPAMPGGS